MKLRSKLLLFVLLAVCSMQFSYAAPSITPDARPLPLQHFLLPVKNAPVIKQPAKKVPLGHYKIAIPGKEGQFTDVYAAMEWEVTSIYEDDELYIEHYDYFIRFYSDGSRINPMALPANLTLNYLWTYNTSDPNDHGHWTQTASGTIGDFEVALGDVEVYVQYPAWWREVVLEMLPGAGYIKI